MSMKPVMIAASAIVCLAVPLDGATGVLACGLRDQIPAEPTAAVSFQTPAAGDNGSKALEGIDPACAVSPTGIDPLIAAGGTSCCDPAQEPGVGGNPLCFEGHSCCANGQWACNDADGTPSCTVCGTTCGLPGSVCTTGTDCCSGVCKHTGRCR